MQIFLSNEYTIENDQIKIFDARIIFQLKNVLRAKLSYTFAIQPVHNPDYVRYIIRLNELTRDSAIGSVGEIIYGDKKNVDITLCVGMLHKFDKCELIVQKCVEIGIPKICFFDADFSQVHSLNQNKIGRLQKIANEAVEQSQGFVVPEIYFEKGISYIHKNRHLVFGDIAGGNFFSHITDNFNNEIGITLVVGPEGGLSKNEISYLISQGGTGVSLGKNILRAETAAIILSREAMKKNY